MLTFLCIQLYTHIHTHICLYCIQCPLEGSHEDNVSRTISRVFAFEEAFKKLKIPIWLLIPRFDLLGDHKEKVKILGIH